MTPRSPTIRRLTGILVVLRPGLYLQHIHPVDIKVIAVVTTNRRWVDNGSHKANDLDQQEFHSPSSNLKESFPAPYKMLQVRLNCFPIGLLASSNVIEWKWSTDGLNMTTRLFAW